MARSSPGGTRPDTPHHHVALWLRATVEMRLRRIYAQGGVWRMCGRGRAGARQERAAQYGGRMFVFATTQGVQGDMPSAIARGSEKNRKICSHRAEHNPHRKKPESTTLKRTFPGHEIEAG